MKPHFHRHSCPQCGHYAGWWRIHFGARDAAWACKSCGCQLSYATKSKWLCILSTFAWFIFAALLFGRFHLIQWWGFAFLVLAGVFPISSLLQVVRQKKDETISPDLHEQPKKV
jgi:hypothetical protein